MDSRAHLEVVEQAGATFADLAQRTDLSRPVALCPGWDVAELVRHLGTVHRWATAIVTGPLHERLPWDQLDARYPETPAGIVPWFREGLAGLIDALASAPPDLDCWTFGPAPDPRSFWRRRQAHELAVHLVDLSLAAGEAVPELSPDFAADGVDELLWVMLRGRAARADDAAAPRLRVVATDTGAAWQVALSGERDVAIDDAGAAIPATATVRGDAAGLYLLLWNRRNVAAFDVDGDRSVLELWRTKRVR